MIGWTPQGDRVSDLYRREGLYSAMYYCWLKGFIEAGKARLKGDSIWDATQSAVKKLKAENGWLKGLVSDPVLRIQLLKKSLNLYGADGTGG